MKIIGLCGKMGSGKDYIGQEIIIKYIEEKLKKKCLQLSFADQLKANVIVKSNIKYEDVYINKTMESRKLLQQEGTENGRRIHGENVWIKYIENWIKVFSKRGVDVFVITDVRFKNEIEWVKSQEGYLIKLESPNRTNHKLQQESGGNEEIYKELANHYSETDIDNIPNKDFHLLLNNDNDNVNQNVNILHNVIENYIKLS